MNTLRFISVSAQAGAARTLRPEDPAASFELADGRAVTAPTSHLSPFQHLLFTHWRAPLRARLIQALCAHVRAAPWLDEAAGTVDLAARFISAPDRDEPDWRVLGFRHLQNVDRKLIKHVLAVGRDPADRDAVCEWWSAQLGVAVDRARLLQGLDGAGCTRWRELEVERDADAPEPVDLYGGLGRAQRTRCVVLLSELRERFMELVRDNATRVGAIARARHAHLGNAQRATMHFVDDSGLVIVTKGRRDRLAVATAFSALDPGVPRLNAESLNRRRERLYKDIVMSAGSARVHSPQRWRDAP